MRMAVTVGVESVAAGMAMILEPAAMYAAMTLVQQTTPATLLEGLLERIPLSLIASGGSVCLVAGLSIPLFPSGRWQHSLKSIGPFDNILLQKSAQALSCAAVGSRCSNANVTVNCGFSFRTALSASRRVSGSNWLSSCANYRAEPLRCECPRVAGRLRSRASRASPPPGRLQGLTTSFRFVMTSTLSPGFKLWNLSHGLGSVMT